MSVIFVDILKRGYYYWNDFHKNNVFPVGLYSYHQNGKYYSVDGNVALDFEISPAGKISSKILGHLDITSTVVGAAAKVVTVASLSSLPIAGPVLAGTAWVTGGVSGYTAVRALYDRSIDKQSISFRDREYHGYFTSILASVIGLGASFTTSSTLSAVENGHFIGKIANAAVSALNGSVLVTKSVGIISSLEHLVQRHREHQLTARDIALYSASLLLFLNTRGISLEEIFNGFNKSSDFSFSYPYFSTVLSVVQQLALKEMLKDFPEVYQHIILQLSESIFPALNDTLDSGGYLKIAQYVCDYVRSSILSFGGHSNYIVEILRDRIQKVSLEKIQDSKFYLAFLEQLLLNPKILFDMARCVKSFHCQLMDLSPLFQQEGSVNYLQLASVANILLKIDRFQGQTIIECDQKMFNAFGFKKISSLTSNLLELCLCIEEIVIAMDRNFDNVDKDNDNDDSSSGTYYDYSKYCMKAMELLYDGRIIKFLTKKIYKNIAIDRNIDNVDKDNDNDDSSSGTYYDYSKYCMKAMEFLYDDRIIKFFTKKIYQNVISYSENQSSDTE